MTLILSLSSLLSCGFFGSKKEGAVLPKAKGTRQEKIEYHRKEINKYRAQKEKEDSNAKRALSRQDMDSARDAQNRKMQYQKKIDKHVLQMNELRSDDEDY